MKKNLHPELQNVIFQDVLTGGLMLIKSTQQSAETMLWEDGKEYPAVKVEISSQSHAAFTGQEKVQAQSTRAERFNTKFGRESIH